VHLLFVFWGALHV